MGRKIKILVNRKLKNSLIFELLVSVEIRESIDIEEKPTTGFTKARTSTQQI